MKKIILTIVAVLVFAIVFLKGCVADSNNSSLKKQLEESQAQVSELQTKYDELLQKFESDKDRPKWVDLYTREYSENNITVKAVIGYSSEGNTVLRVDLTGDDDITKYAKQVVSTYALANSYYEKYGITNYSVTCFRSSHYDDYEDTYTVFLSNGNGAEGRNEDGSLTYGKAPDWLLPAMSLSSDELAEDSGFIINSLYDYSTYIEKYKFVWGK